MIVNSKYSLLFIEPKLAPEASPVIDEYTLKLAYQMAHFTKIGVFYNGGFSPNISTMGVHTCTGDSCSAQSNSYDILLPCGLPTNTLALHYVMYHRSEVPVSDLQKIESMEYDPAFTMADYDKRTNRSDLITENRWKSVDEKELHILPFDFDRNRLMAKKNGYTVPELKEILTFMCLNTKGRKSELIERIQPFI